jgi:hypothetical protein
VSRSIYSVVNPERPGEWKPVVASPRLAKIQRSVAEQPLDEFDGLVNGAWIVGRHPKVRQLIFGRLTPINGVIH